MKIYNNHSKQMYFHEAAPSWNSKNKL